MTRVLGDAAALLLGLAGAACVLAGAAREPGAFDECSFQAALRSWDLLAFEPHFPGYPLAVLLARVAASAGAAAPYAAVAALLLPCGAIALHRGVGGGVGGLVAAGLFGLGAPLLRAAALPMADGIATAFLALGLAAAVRPRPLLAGLSIGLAAGAKPDLLPWLSLGLPVVLAVAPRDRRGAAVRFALGAGLPLACAAVLAATGAGGWGALAGEAVRFTRGHLFEWGGAVTAGAGRGSRMALLLAPFEACGGLAFLGAAVLLPLALHAPRRLRRGAVLAGVPYGLWMLLGQNPDQPRHALPFLPLLALLAGAGLARTRVGPWLRATLAAALLLGAASGALRVAGAPPRPVDVLCAWAAGLDPLSTRVYAGASARVLRARVPGLDVRRARDLAAVRLDLAADVAPSPDVLVLSEVVGSDGLERVAAIDPFAVHLLPREEGPP